MPFGGFVDHVPKKLYVLRLSWPHGVGRSNSHGARLLGVASRPGPGPADVGDHARNLDCRRVVWRHSQHGVLTSDGADYLQALDPIENVGDSPRSTVAGVDDDGVLRSGDVEDEARQDLYTGGAGFMGQRKIAVADLEHT